MKSPPTPRGAIVSTSRGAEHVQRCHGGAKNPWASAFALELVQPSARAMKSFPTPRGAIVNTSRGAMEERKAAPGQLKNIFSTPRGALVARKVAPGKFKLHYLTV